MSKEQKLSKARKRRKEFEKKRNVKNNNWPEEKANRHGRLNAGDGVIPASQKTRLNKKTKQKKELVREKEVKTITNN